MRISQLRIVIWFVLVVASFALYTVSTGRYLATAPPFIEHWWHLVLMADLIAFCAIAVGIGAVTLSSNWRFYRPGPVIELLMTVTVLGGMGLHGLIMLGAAVATFT